MICNTCNNKGIENQAGGNKFWYCKTCKDEITENPYSHMFVMPSPGDGLLDQLADAAHEELLDEMDSLHYDTRACNSGRYKCGAEIGDIAWADSEIEEDTDDVELDVLDTMDYPYSSAGRVGLIMDLLEDGDIDSEQALELLKLSTSNPPEDTF